MEISIYNQLTTVLFSIVLGAFCGILYDIVKIFRNVLVQNYSEKFKIKHLNKTFKGINNPLLNRISKKSKIYSYITIMLFDILYFILLTPIFCIFTYIMNDGIVRWYIFVFSLLGFTGYKISIGRLFGAIIDYFSFYLRILIIYLVKFIKIPFKRLNLRAKIDIIKAKAKNKNKTKAEVGKRELIIQFGK